MEDREQVAMRGLFFLELKQNLNLQMEQYQLTQNRDIHDLPTSSITQNTSCKGVQGFFAHPVYKM
jgi:hypothetical protein